MGQATSWPDSSILVEHCSTSIAALGHEFKSYSVLTISQLVEH